MDGNVLEQIYQENLEEDIISYWPRRRIYPWKMQ